MPTPRRSCAAALIATLAVAACTPPGSKPVPATSVKPRATAAPGSAAPSGAPSATAAPVRSAGPVAAMPPALLGVGVFGGAGIIGQNGATLAGQGGATVVGPNGASIVGHNGAGLVATKLTGLVRGPAGVLSNAGGQIVTDNGAGIVTDNGAGIVTDNGAGIVTDNGAGIVTDNGAGIVTDNGAGAPPGSLRRFASARVSDAGGGVVSNQGGAYRLAALDQVPYAGATVHLLDASGRPVTGAAGQPLTAVTDAQGRYTLQADLPAANLVLAAALPGDGGQLGAITPRGDQRSTDLDLVSTLTAGYVLTRYVRPQADSQATLDRLPAALEAATRQAVADALTAGVAAGRPVPTRLASTDELAVAVDGLRRDAAPLDERLEEVRRALLVGLPDLGAGRVATEVALPWIRGVVAAPGGGFWLSAALAGRVMYVGADGRLVTHAGNAAGMDPGSLAGKPAADVGLGVIQGLLSDGDGLLILEQRRLTRRDAAGQLSELWPLGPTYLSAVGRQAGGGWWLLARDGCWQLTPGAAPVKAHPLDPDASAFVRRVAAFGQDPEGRLLLLGTGKPKVEVRRYDPLTGSLTPVTAVGEAGVRGLAVDAAGGLYVQDAAGAILDGPAGAVRVPAAAKVTTSAAAFATTPAGATLWALLGQVKQVVGGVVTLVAGKSGVSVDADGQLALNRPGGLLVEPDGALLVSVAGDNQVVRVQGGQVTAVAGGGADGDGGPATNASLPNPTALRRDMAGNRYVLQAGRAIRRIAPDGLITTTYALPVDQADRRVYDFAVTSDGATLYVTGAITNGGTPALPRAGFVTRLDLATKAETVIVAPDPGPTHVIALDAAQRLHLIGGGTLRRWDAVAGFSEVARDPLLKPGSGWTALARAAFDPRGRLWWFTGDSADTLCRLDGGVATVVAGPGGPFLSGDGVDDSLLNGMAPVFTADGDVLFCDVSHNQVKRLAGAAR